MMRTYCHADAFSDEVCCTVGEVEVVGVHLRALWFSVFPSQCYY